MSSPYHLFQRFGVELEYMIVDEATLNIRPIADSVIHLESGTFEQDVDRGPMQWSNELALHVIELKTGRPVARLNGLEDKFHKEVQYLNRKLRRTGCRLLPTAAHPWMNPHRESRLWPHGNREIYEAFDRIFNCSGHGWTNLQSTHLNLPFANDDEFLRLHTAIRLILPLLPALAASSPFIDGGLAPNLDMRLETYRSNCALIPSITAAVVPEPIRSISEYQKKILNRIYRDLKPHDPTGILQEEWSNARGAIARFERNTIEIRVLDIQECPMADLAIIQFIVAMLEALCDQTFSTTQEQLKPRTHDLHRLLLETIHQTGDAPVRSKAILHAFGLSGRTPLTVRDVLSAMLERCAPERAAWREVIEFILSQGTLSERMVRALDGRPTRPRLKALYSRLAECLAKGRLFDS